MRRSAAERLRSGGTQGTAWLAQLRAGIGAPLGVAAAHTRGLIDGSRGPLSADQKAQLHEIERQVNQATRLVCDLIDLARLEAGELPLDTASFDLTEVIGQVITQREPEARDRGLTIAFAAPPRPLPMVTADRARVTQILAQLVEHAVRAGGAGQVTISTELYNRSVALHVSDRGPGLPAASLAALLRDPDGAEPDAERLGFALCRRLVSRMGGDLWGTSTSGEGSRFSFTVPRVADDSGGSSKPPTP